MFANIYKAQPAGVVGLSSGEEVQIGLVVESGWKRLGHIYAVESEPGCWISFDSRKVPALKGAFEGVSRADAPRIQALGEAIGKAFKTREALAWALCGAADGLVASALAN